MIRNHIHIAPHTLHHPHHHALLCSFDDGVLGVSSPTAMPGAEDAGDDPSDSFHPRSNGEDE
jgi:hypothetical protein